jgi:hypothetical protein
VRAAPRPHHPRLIALPEDFARLRGQVRAERVSRLLHGALLQRAEHFLALPPLERKVSGFRLLLVAREAQQRVLALALCFQIDGDRRFLERARLELSVLASFEDWNPGHFLDVAEMATAVALGLDWLHDELTAEERLCLSEALRRKALAPSLTPEQDGRPRFWISSGNNWNQVCHGGLVLAALATWEDDPHLASAIVERARGHLRFGAAVYAPDGVYPEGTTYWDYGTVFHVLTLAALRSALGTDFGLGDFPGFPGSPEFFNQATAPSGAPYAFADNWAERVLSAALFWFALDQNRPDFVEPDVPRLEGRLADWAATEGNRSQQDRFLALILLWWRPASPERGDGRRAPLIWCGRGKVPVVVFRSGWGDPRAVYLASKGGAASDPHGHMDAGSFVLEADGVRWAEDQPLRADDYFVLEGRGVKLWDQGQGSQRWKLFTRGARGHGILVLDDEDPRVEGRGQLAEFSAEPAFPGSTFDLTALWPAKVRRYERGFRVLGACSVVVEDTLEVGEREVRLRWQWVTRAAVAVESPTRVRLELDGRRAVLDFHAPAPVRFTVSEAADLQEPFDLRLEGVRRLDAALVAPARATFRLRVEFQALDAV